MINKSEYYISLYLFDLEGRIYPVQRCLRDLLNHIIPQVDTIDSSLVVKSNWIESHIQFTAYFSSFSDDNGCFIMQANKIAKSLWITNQIWHHWLHFSSQKTDTTPHLLVYSLVIQMTPYNVCFVDHYKCPNVCWFT